MSYTGTPELSTDAEVDAECACRRFRPLSRSRALQTRAGLPVIEGDPQLVLAGRQRAEVDFTAQRGTMAPGPTPTSPWATRSPLRGSMTCTARE